MFKIGDKVEVIKPYHEDWEEEDIPSDDFLVGHTGTICHIGEYIENGDLSYYIDFGEFLDGDVYCTHCDFPMGFTATTEDHYFFLSSKHIKLSVPLQPEFEF